MVIFSLNLLVRQRLRPLIQHYVNVKLVKMEMTCPKSKRCFDCDGTLVDSEVICSRAYVAMFRQFGITLELAEVFRRFKGVKLYEIIDTISKEYGVALAKAELEPVYRAEVARLFDTELEAIAGANTLLESIKTPMCGIQRAGQ